MLKISDITSAFEACDERDVPMKIFFVFCLLSFGFVFSLWKYGGMDQTVLAKWEKQLHYEKKALTLARENRLLKAQISDLRYQLSQQESKQKFLAAKGAPARQIASIPQSNPHDLVNYEIYKWTPEKLLAIGEK